MCKNKEALAWFRHLYVIHSNMSSSITPMYQEPALQPHLPHTLTSHPLS